MVASTPAAIEMAAHRLDAARFSAAYGGLYLLHRRPVSGDPDMPFHTMRGSLAGLDEAVEFGACAAQIARVEKREGNPYPDRITVGRAANCDVVLRFPFMSKLHAVFVVSHAGLALLDRESSNGTKLNDVRLPPNMPQPVSAGDLIEFAALRCELVDGRRLHAFLTGASD